MKILLDTATFLWICLDSPKMTDYSRKVFSDLDNDVYLSVISPWEIAVKHMLGRLPLPEAPDRFISAQRDLHGIDSLPLDEESTLHLLRLPALHRDPFDRMLVCQGIVHGMVVLTPDPLISQYPVRTAW